MSWWSDRNTRREAEILACLADGEARTGPMISQAIGGKSETIYSALARLDGDRRIMSFWKDINPGVPRRFYRGVL
jgi:hypothetical protein